MSNKISAGKDNTFKSLSDLIGEICENSDEITRYDNDQLMAYYIANKKVITRDELEQISQYYAKRSDKKSEISPKDKVIMYNGEPYKIYRINNGTMYAKSLKDGKKTKVDLNKVGSMKDLIEKVKKYDFIEKKGNYEINKKSKNPIQGKDLESKLKNFYDNVNNFLDNFLKYNSNNQGKLPKGDNTKMPSPKQNNNYDGDENMNQMGGNYPTIKVPYEKELAEEGSKVIWPRWYKLNEKIENDGLKIDTITAYSLIVKMNSKKDFKELKEYATREGYNNLEMVISDVDTITDEDKVKGFFESRYGKEIAKYIVDYIEKEDLWDKVKAMNVKKYNALAKKAKGIDVYLKEIKKPFLNATAYMNTISDDGEAYIGNILNG